MNSFKRDTGLIEYNIGQHIGKSYKVRASIQVSTVVAMRIMEDLLMVFLPPRLPSLVGSVLLFRMEKYLGARA